MFAAKHASLGMPGPIRHFLRQAVRSVSLCADAHRGKLNRLAEKLSATTGERVFILPIDSASESDNDGTSSESSFRSGRLSVADLPRKGPSWLPHDPIKLPSTQATGGGRRRGGPGSDDEDEDVH